MFTRLKKKENIWLICSIIAFAAIVLPYLIVATYASPGTDDFGWLNSVLNHTNKTYLGKVLSTTLDFYLSWQGTYTGCFLGFLGGGIFHMYGIDGLQVEYIINICFFFATFLYLMIRVAYKLETNKKKGFALAFTLATILLFIGLYDFDVSQAFYWHTGFCVYTVPFSISLVMTGILLKEELKTADIVIASILGFIASGGSLEVSAFVCGISLLLVFYKCLRAKKADKSCAVFVASFAGALVNVAAPGNFARHDALSSHYAVVKSLLFACVDVAKSLWEYVGNGTILIMVLLCLLMFNKLKKIEIKYINPLILASILILGLIIVEFPVYYGYSSSYFPSRCEFVRRIIMVIFLFVTLMDLTGWYAKKTGADEIKCSVEKIFGFIVACFIALNLCFPNGCAESVEPINIYKDICYNPIFHNLSKFEDTTREILSTLENSPGEDVVIKVSEYDNRGYLKALGLRSDPTYGVNIAAASYYGNNSITFIVEDGE